jgi:TetR/AcrR family transcriptional repressor of nem operon
MDGAATLGDYITNYLSGSHRDMPGRGCPFAALSCEMPRQSGAVRERFTDGLRAIVKRMASRMDSALKQRQRYEEALATVATLVGALVLARAVNDPKLSDDILRATNSRLKG